MELIENKAAYYIALAKIEQSIEKGFEHLSEDETNELQQLSLSVERFEEIEYPMPVKATIPGLLDNIMYEKKMNRTQLSKFLEIPNSTLTEIMKGKKNINMSIAKKLHNKLNIDGNLILEMV